MGRGNVFTCVCRSVQGAETSHNATMMHPQGGCTPHPLPRRQTANRRAVHILLETCPCPHSKASEGYIFTGICLSNPGGRGREVDNTKDQPPPPWPGSKVTTPPPCPGSKVTTTPPCPGSKVITPLPWPGSKVITPPGQGQRSQHLPPGHCQRS